MPDYGAVKNRPLQPQKILIRPQKKSYPDVRLIGVGLAFATLAFVGVSLSHPASRLASGDLAVHASTCKSSSDEILIQGVYDTERVGADYPWMANYSALAEPFRKTQLKVLDSEASSESFTWTERNDAGDDERLIGSGSSIEHVFSCLGGFEISVINTETRCRLTRLIVVKYVRREIRSLHDEDREKFFDTMQVLWNVSTSVGQELYGSSYQSIADLTKGHAKLAGAQYCDHMHDGLGFMTMHLALGMQFEQSLQAISPEVSLPYWDYTIDETNVQNGSWASIDDSPMWLDEWFGARDGGDDHMISEGRWAYTPVTTGAWDETHNSYGIMRGPWNNNPRPFVTRSSNLCGYTGFNLPTCESHFDALADHDTWYDFAWSLPYSPHGNVHVVIGGNVDCVSVYDEIEAYLVTKIRNATVAKQATDSLRSTVFAMTKNSYRHYVLDMPTYCSMDTPFSECHGQCLGLKEIEEWYHSGTENKDADQAKRREMNYLLKQVGAWDTVKKLCVHGVESGHCAQIQFKVLATMCKAGIGISGDQLEAGSPQDPSFWPIHPTIERLWTWKKILTANNASGGFTSEEWPTLGSAQVQNCTGHARHDTVPFEIRLDLSGSFRTYTNLELYDIANPTSSSLPFIYDKFEWPHCEEAGFDLRSPVSTSVPE